MVFLLNRFGSWKTGLFYQLYILNYVIFLWLRPILRCYFFCLVFLYSSLISGYRALGISLGESVMVKWYALTFMHWEYWCSGSQGPPALVTALICLQFGCNGLVSHHWWFPANGHCLGHDIKCVIPNLQ